MKNLLTTVYLLLASSFLMGSAQAHDPSEHMKKSEKPKCEAMKDMDHSKLDADDLVMMAMMKKCMSNASSDSHHTEGSMKKTEEESNAAKAEKHDDGDKH